MPSRRFEMILSEEDQAVIWRIRESIIKRNEFVTDKSLSLAGVIRHCLMACDPGESDEA